MKTELFQRMEVSPNTKSWNLPFTCTQNVLSNLGPDPGCDHNMDCAFIDYTKAFNEFLQSES